jgi:glutamine amidotransferase
MIAIINYNAGNIRSVANAFEYLKQEVLVTNEEEYIERADAIVVPGVGAFGYAIKSLTELGLMEILTDQVVVRRKPYLGICLGLQLLSKTVYEYGEYKGLGWIKGSVEKLEPMSRDCKIPHIGWNNVNYHGDLASDLFQGIEDHTDFYFLHSYAIRCSDPDVITSVCNHGVDFVSSVQDSNIYGVQFHPEKSQRAGLQLLKNFIEIVNAEKESDTGTDTE